MARKRTKQIFCKLIRRRKAMTTPALITAAILLIGYALIALIALVGTLIAMARKSRNDEMKIRKQ